MLYWKFLKRIVVAAGAVVIVAVATSAATNAQIFEDATTSAGLTKSGERWGASWGDLNGDGWVDLFVNNHRERNSLYRNNGDGSFREVTLEVDRDNSWDLNATRISRDTHGAAWADVDNDGDSDLLVSVSGGNPDGHAQFMLNQGGYFLDQAVVTNLADDGRARHSIWLDYDGDGRLDVVSATNNAMIVKRQDDASTDLAFEPDSGPLCSSNHSAMLSDVNDNGSLDLICFPRGGAFPEKVYDYGGGGFVDVTDAVPGISTVPDVAVGDFDRDLRPDFFLLRGVTRRAQVAQVDSNRIEAWVAAANSAQMGFDFASNGSLDLDIFIDGEELEQVFIGAGGISPMSLPITLDPTNVDHQGIAAPSNLGAYIGFDPATQRWQLIWQTDNKSRRAYVILDTAMPASDLQVSGLRAVDLPMAPRLLMNLATGYEEQSGQRGLGVQIACNSAVAADFDNDMDEDIFVTCTRGIENLPDRLFVNDGAGNFTEMISHGAEGVTGAGLANGAGASDSVIVADYDNDGFQDVFVTNGILLQPMDAGGPDQLFRNLGNGNNWIKLNLRGSGPPSGSNRDGIGARVFASAGGITQLRQQNGGYHRWSQNDQQIHFGLASHTTVSDLTVEWPSGQTDTFTNLAANRVYDVNEGGTIEVVELGPALGSPTPQPGDECTAPQHDAHVDAGVFVWKNCATNRWMVRAAAGGRPQTVYGGDVETSAGFNSIGLFSLESADDVRVDGLNIDFDLAVAGQDEDGFQFELSDPDGDNNCLTLGAGELFVGEHALPAPNPLNLKTLEQCVPATAGTAAIGDFAWNDLNGNGQQDPGEPGLAGVTVNLLDCGGNPLASTTTDSNGAYVHGALAAGTYMVEFVAPVGFDFSPLRQGPGDTDSNADPRNGLSHCMTLADGQSRTWVDAGLVEQSPQTNGRIGDFVWLDLNENGIQDPAEPGLEGVVIDLRDCDGNTLATTVSGLSGAYQFNLLGADTYQVRFFAPAGLSFSPRKQGVGGEDSNPDPATGLTRCLSLATGQSRFGIDAGLR